MARNGSGRRRAWRVLVSTAWLAALLVTAASGQAMAGGPLRLDPPPPKPPRLILKADPSLFAAAQGNPDLGALDAGADPASATSITENDELPSELSAHVVARDRKDELTLQSPADFNSSRVTNLMDDVGLDELRIEMRARF